MTHTPRILAIDDTPANLHTLGNALEGEFELCVATSGAQGLALAAESPPDLILLDVMMPEIDGYETCRALKADPRLRDIPVVFVTALGEAQSEAAGLALGAADYIVKPFNVEITRQRLRNLLERERLRREVEAQRDHLEERVRTRTAELAQAKNTAEAASRAKSAFLANVSHEIRTPLNAILGMAFLVKRGGLTPKQQEQMGKLDAASRSLTDAIDAILDFSNLESGALTLAETPFQLDELLRSAAESIQDPARAKRLGLSVEPAPPGTRYLGDPARLKQALLNYAKNAAKFTESGAIVLRAKPVEETESDALLRFEVEDTGPGIPAEVLSRLFSPFEQADNSLTRKHEGAGLGLAVTRRLAELMGGASGASSVPGSGSVFWFTARVKKAVESEG
jgi:signal transduction histidine kinase